MDLQGSHLTSLRAVEETGRGPQRVWGPQEGTGHSRRGFPRLGSGRMSIHFLSFPLCWRGG